jgi:cytochrome b involved in lipid metabolism
MKKLTFAAFVAFWVSTAAILTLSGLAPEAAGQPESELRTISLTELAEHDRQDSCWMAIEGRVYDLTDYIPLHPTPPVVLLPWCGVEATEGMRTKGYGRDHSAAAWGMLDAYLIGVLDE